MSFEAKQLGSAPRSENIYIDKTNSENKNK